MSSRLDFLRFGKAGRRNRSRSSSRTRTTPVEPEDESSRNPNVNNNESDPDLGLGPLHALDTQAQVSLQLNPQSDLQIPDQPLDPTASTEKPTRTLVAVLGRHRSSSRVRSGTGDAPVFPGKHDLTIIHEPASRNLDIIFVHGLGGGSRKTWCYDKNPTIFWPEWLPQISTLSNTRIATFGYNADIVGQAGTTQSDVESFAKRLLHCLTIHGQRHEKYGRVPIIFICHSMGGLVVKRACVKADRDESLRKLSTSFSGIIFLGTPHRGSSQARKLNSLVSLFGRGGAGKAYIQDLTINSGLLQSLNDDFRHLAKRIRLFSFGEQKKTPIGTFEVMIVEPFSSILGYPDEGSAPLFADHHLVCKFSSPVDPNYISVTRTLVSMAEKILEDVHIMFSEDRKRHVEEIYQFLLTPDLISTEADYLAMKNKRLEGSCNWVPQNTWFAQWIQGSLGSSSRILWINALPGTGKSVISTFLIDQVKESGHNCYYYFFKSSDISKRSLERCLLSLAYQIASAEPSVRHRLLELQSSHGQFHGAMVELLLLWQRLFVTTILPVYEHEKLPLFVVVDALDEAENSMAIFSLLKTFRHVPNLRLCITSRPSVEFAQQFGLLANKIQINTHCITKEDNAGDISCLMDTALSSLPLSEEVKVNVVESVIRKAEGNILWAEMVARQMLLTGFSEESLLEVIKQVPPGMNSVYADILVKMSILPLKQQEIGKWIMLWALSSFQPLHISQVQEALQFDPPGEKIDRLEFWVAKVCGSFLLVDHRKRLQPIHATAREFLLSDTTTDYAITPSTHLHIAKVCLDSILNVNSFDQTRIASTLKGSRDNYAEPNTLWRYAAFWWSDHLTLAKNKSDVLLDLVGFVLKSPKFADCIREIARSGDLGPLVRTAKNLKQFIDFFELDDISTRKEDFRLLTLWTIDLIRLTTEFGENFLRFPSEAESLIAPFCPRSSVLFNNFGTREGGIVILGDIPENWGTRVACLSSLRTSQVAATTLCSSGNLVAVGYQNGLINVWNSTTGILLHELDFADFITSLTFNHTGSYIAASGKRMIKIWDASTASEYRTLAIVDVPILLAFSANELLLFAVFCHNNLAVYNLEDGDVITQFDWDKVELAKKVVAASPIYTSLNSTRTQMALAYRGRPISVWDIEKKAYLKRVRLPCRIPSHKTIHGSGQLQCANYTHDDVQTMEYHSRKNEIFISYRDGTFVKWNTDTNDLLIAEGYANIHVMRCSPDGTILVTGNSSGEIQIWSTETLELLFYMNEDEDAVRMLCFNTTGTRIFDVRGVYCNVWEPEILFQGVKIYRETTQLPLAITQSHGTTFTNSTSVTSIRVSPNGMFFIAGTENGNVNLYSMSSGKKLKKLYNHGPYGEITSIAWSKDSRMVATGDKNSTVFVYRLSVTDGDVDMLGLPELTDDDIDHVYDAKSFEYESRLEITTMEVLKGHIKVAGSLDSMITSLIISDDQDLLIASTFGADSVWRLMSLSSTEKSSTKKKALNSWLTICYGFERQRQFLYNPKDDSTIIIVDSDSVRIRSWSSIKSRIDNISDPPQNPLQCDASDDHVIPYTTNTKTDTEPYDQPDTILQGLDRCFMTNIGDENFLITCQIKPRFREPGRRKEIWAWKLNDGPEEGKISIEPRMCLGTSITSPTMIKSLLGAFDQKIYFLDSRGWICSKNLDLLESGKAIESAGSKSDIDSKLQDEQKQVQAFHYKDGLAEFDMKFFLPRGQVIEHFSSIANEAIVWKKDVILTQKERVIVVKRGLRGDGIRINSTTTTPKRS